MTSRIGLSLTAAYLALGGYLIATQGFTGESFITIILGLPWSLIPSYFEYGQVGGITLYILLLAPLALNAVILYWIGKLLGNLVSPE